jgi:hypothetical protein
MGLFGRNRNNQNQQSSQRSENIRTKFDDAMDYFSGEQIQCLSSTDRETVERLYSTLKEDNYDTSDDSNLRDAISSLDANIYNLCKALIYQNFMLMRKVDELSRRIDDLERDHQ